MGEQAQASPDVFAFGGFELDVAARELRRGAAAILVRPRTWDVLVHLVTNAGQMVSREYLLREVWKGVHVGDETVAASIRELRRVFEDSAREPRFLQTVYKVGYRLVAPVYRGGRRVWPRGRDGAPARELLVGRDAELVALAESWDEARRGLVQSRLVTGSVGIGKSALVGHFLDKLDRADGVVTAVGRCAEQRGRGEPYLPIMQLLAAMAAHRHGQRVRAVLRRHASQWWVHMPSVHDEEDAGLVERAGPGFAPRMIRELVDALEVVARQTPVMAIVEDLQWSDTSTLDALGALLQPRNNHRLLLIATVRSGETQPDGGRLDVPALRERLAARELHLERLPMAATETYVEARLGRSADCSALAQALHRSTGGHPMFLARAVEELIARGLVHVEPGGWSLPAGLDVAERRA